MQSNILKRISLTGLILLSLSVYAQEITVMTWNILSFETNDKSGQNAGFPIDDFIKVFQQYNPDILCFNEFETKTSRMGKEKMAEVASRMGMYGYFIQSYPKDVGYYGNVILSKYPIISSASKLMDYKNHKGIGNWQFNSGKELDEYGADQRSIGYCDIIVSSEKEKRKIIRVVCSHFDHLGRESVRKRQAEESVGFASLSSPEHPTIMCGDLNTMSDETLTPINSIGDLIANNWVDYIFCFPKNAWTKIKQDVFPSGNLSDHNAVIVKIKLN